MKILFPTKELKSALRQIAPAVASNPIVPILENVLIEIDKGSASVTGTNLNVTVSKTFSISDKQSVKMCLPFAMLNKFISKINTAEIEIEILENSNKVQIKSSQAKATIEGDSPGDWPNLPEMEDGKRIVISSSVLDEMIDRVGSFAHVDAVEKPNMSQVHLICNDGIVAQSTNGHVASVLKLDADIKDSFEIDLHLDFMKCKGMFEDQPVIINADDKRFEITGDDLSFSGRMSEIKFPDVNNVMPVKSDGSLVRVDRSLLITELDRAEIFANSKTHMSKLTFKPKKLIIETSDIDFGNDYLGEIDIDYAGGELALGMDIAALKKLISKTTSSEIEMYHFGAPNKAILIIDGDFTALQMPMML